MGIIERKQRQKDDTRLRIVTAALKIGKEEGWNALSMRKIGDMIEYSVPIIYEHFDSKEALLQELARIGFLKLAKNIQTAVNAYDHPAEQLEVMWLNYWNFAFTEKEFYQLMFGVEFNCCSHGKQLSEAALPETLISDVIRRLLPEENKSDNKVSRTYYTFWSVVHGLISLNMIGHSVPDNVNDQVLTDAIGGIIRSISMT